MPRKRARTRKVELSSDEDDEDTTSNHVDADADGGGNAGGIVHLISDDEEPPLTRCKPSEIPSLETVPDVNLDGEDDEDDIDFEPAPPRRSTRRKKRKSEIESDAEEERKSRRKRRNASQTAPQLELEQAGKRRKRGIVRPQPSQDSSPNRSQRPASTQANYSSLTDPAPAPAPPSPSPSPPPERRKRTRRSRRAVQSQEPASNGKRAQPTRKALSQEARGGELKWTSSDHEKDVEVVQISSGDDEDTRAEARSRKRLVPAPVSAPALTGASTKPPDASNLSVSHQKRKEIRNWLSDAISGACPRLLLLHGPPGCGKWSALRALLAERGLEYVEWVPSTPPARTSVLDAMLDSLDVFLKTASYPSLTSASDGRRTVIIRELPIVGARAGAWSGAGFAKHRERLDRLQTILGQYALNTKVPSVLLLSDCGKGVARQIRMLGNDLAENSCTIKIYPLSATATRKVLKRTAQNEHLPISNSRLQKLADGAAGDLRAALTALRLGSGSSGVSSGGGRDSTTALLGLDKDGTLATFHAVSKVLNNKRNPDGSSKYDPEALLDDSQADPGAFVGFLHTNYPPFFSASHPDAARDPAQALDALSDADIMMKWCADQAVRDDLARCASSVATRAFLEYNTQPVQKGWRPIRAPEWYKDTARTNTENARLLTPFVAVGARDAVLERAAFVRAIGAGGTSVYRNTNAVSADDMDAAMVEAEVREHDARVEFDDSHAQTKCQCVDAVLAPQQPQPIPTMAAPTQREGEECEEDIEAWSDG